MAQAPQGSESGTGGTETAASTTAAVTATQEQNNPTTTSATGTTGTTAATPATTSTTAPAAASGTSGTTGTTAPAATGGSGSTQRGAPLGSGTNKFASSSLYVGDLSKDVTEATLFELFNAVGPVASIRVCRDGATRQSLGYAYVNFHSTKDAERALDTMNFANIKGKQCRIMWSQRDPSLRRSNRGNVFVKCLHESIDNKTLYDTFSVFGNILSCKVATNEDGSSRQYGYVHYVDEASAKKAIEGVNGMSINNKVVEACAFQPRSEREKNLSFTNVYVKYIPRHCDEAMCKEAFGKLVSDKLGEEAEITASKFWVQPYGVSGCFNFKQHEQAKTAVDVLNGFDLRTIYPEPNEDKDAAANDDEKEVKDENADNANNDEEKDNTVTTEEKDVSGDTEEQKEEKAAIVGVVAGNKDLNKKSQQRSLFATRAVKRKTRDFLLARERGVRGGGYGRGGTRGGIRPNARYYLGGNLYVKHLQPEIDDEKLKEMFASFGEIQSAKVMKQDSGESKGFGFVAFKTKDAATRALHEMNMKQQHGPGAKPLYVSRAQSKHARISRRMSYMNRFGGPGGSGRGGGRGGYNNNNNMYQGVFSNRGGNNQGNQGGGYNPNYNRGYTPAGGIYGPAGMVNPNQQGLSNINPNQLNQQGLNINNPNQGINVNTQQQNLMNMGGIPSGITNVGVPGVPGGITNVQRMGPGGITQMGPTGIPNTATNPRMLQQYGGAAAAAAMQGNIATNPLVNQGFFNRNAMGGPNINSALQQLFPFQTQLGPQTSMNIGGGGNTNTSGNIPNVGNVGGQNRGGNIVGQQGGISSTGVLNNPQGINLGAQQQSFNNQQTSATNPMVGGNRNLQNVTALPSTGTANVTNPASSQQMQFPQSVPRTQFSVQSGGIGITQSQQQSQPTNTSVPQGGQSASVLSAGGRDSAAMKESHPLTQQMLSRIATPAEKKRLIGERLFPKIQVVEPRLAGKITGMLLEMDNKILLTLLNDNTALHGKINEALAVLQEHHKSQQNASNANRASSSNAPQ